MSEIRHGYTTEILEPALARSVAKWAAPGEGPRRGAASGPVGEVATWVDEHPHLDALIVESHVTYDMAIRESGEWHWASDERIPKSFVGPSCPRLEDVEQVRLFGRAAHVDDEVVEVLVFRGMSGEWSGALRRADARVSNGAVMQRERRYLVSTKECSLINYPHFTWVTQPNGKAIMHPWPIQKGQTHLAVIREVTFEDDTTGVRWTGATLFAGYENGITA